MGHDSTENHLTQKLTNNNAKLTIVLVYIRSNLSNRNIQVTITKISLSTVFHRHWNHIFNPNNIFRNRSVTKKTENATTKHSGCALMEQLQAA